MRLGKPFFRHSKALEKLLNICTSPEYDNEQKIDATEKITKFNSQAVPYLITILGDKEIDRSVRTVAAKGLGKLGKNAVDALPYLEKSLSEENDLKLRRAAAMTLGEIGASAATVIPSLLTLLADNDLHLNRVAVASLNKIDPKWLQNTKETSSAIPFFVKELLNSDTNARQTAAAFLENLEPQQWEQAEKAPEKIISFLVIAFVKALIHSDTTVRHMTSALLDKLDPQWAQSETARRQIPILVKAKTDSRLEVSSGAAKLLSQIDPAAEKTVPSIVEARLDEGSDSRRQLAAEALKVLDKTDPNWSHIDAARCTISDLIKARVNNESDIRQVADELLTLIEPSWARGKEARNLIPYLVKVLRKKSLDISIRSAAAETLGKMGSPVGEEIVPHFRAVLEENKGLQNSLMFAIESAWDGIDPSGGWRKEMWEVLGEVNPDQENIAPWLRD